MRRDFRAFPTQSKPAFCAHLISSPPPSHVTSSFRLEQLPFFQGGQLEAQNGWPANGQVYVDRREMDKNKWRPRSGQLKVDPRVSDPSEDIFD